MLFYAVLLLVNVLLSLYLPEAAQLLSAVVLWLIIIGGLREAWIVLHAYINSKRDI
ncbi:hypothetical protein [Streptococcus sp. zg-JUN1979]|uniref:hypothetical protein n=1 Tax=Streptococcus sp. zg-JUN1979 TaxID=3391450 RepID=UPI0039A62DB6